MKNRELYKATFEFEFSNSMSAVVDVAQIINGAFGHVISTNFHIIYNEKETHQFSIGYFELINKREDEVNLSEEEKGVYRTEYLAMQVFKEKIKEDIYLFLKEFVDNSKNRLERKREKHE